MVSKSIAIIGLILVIGLGIVLVLTGIPSSAVTGGTPTTVCTVRLEASGVYNDYLISHTITGFVVSSSATGCHQETLLDLFPSIPSFNILPFSFSLTATLVDSQGVNHCTCTMQVTVGAGEAAPSFPFSESTTVANVPVGQYLLSVSAPFSINGQSVYTETIIVSQN